MKFLSEIMTPSCLSTCLDCWEEQPTLLLVGTLDQCGLIASARPLAFASEAEVLEQTPPAFGEVVLMPDSSVQLLPMEDHEPWLASLAQLGVGLTLVNLEQQCVHALLEPVRTERLSGVLPEEELAHWFGPEGPIAARLPNFEARASQADMSGSIGAAFADETILLAEAGTGTGKSLAYLLPAMLWAQRTKERVVIATGTIPLQEQLFRKDLPFLQALLPEPVRVALVKGRQNYLCLRRLERAQEDPPTGCLKEDLVNLQRWSEATETGDRSEWKSSLPESLWSEVRAEAESCQRSRCSLYQSCFFYRSRRDLTSADVLITNHHLLLADLTLRYQMGNYESTVILPSFQRCVLDEAHHLEDVASSFLGFSTHENAILLALHRLRPSSNIASHSPALLTTLGRELVERVGGEAHREAQMLDNLKVMWLPTLRHAGRTTRECAATIQSLLKSALPQDLPSKLLVSPSLIYQGPWEAIREVGMRWSEAVEGMLSPLREIVKTLDRWGWLESEEWNSWSLEVLAVRKRLEQASTVLSSFFSPSRENPEPEERPLVRWFEPGGTRNETLQLVAAPLEVGQELQELLWDPMKTVVLTSATLTHAKGDFSFLETRLGLENIPGERLRREVYLSPFDYSANAQVLVPTNLPEPTQEHFPERIVSLLEEALLASGGRAFVLCTSYSLMNFLYKELEGVLREAGIRSLCQGQAARSLLLEQKKADETSVLFGTDSFWEGVDVAGDALKTVILTRLPFRQPTEPLLQARMRWLRAAGQNPFSKLFVPMAVLRFKQGFGRLIRTREDQGSVVVLDTRVCTREYGDLFLQSLPEGIPVLQTETRGLGELLQKFSSDR